MKAPMNFAVLFVILVIALSLGCIRTEQEFPEDKPVSSNSEITKHQDAFEAFVFMAPSEGQVVKSQLESYLLTVLPGGSLCHWIECSDHRLIASVDIPFGPVNSRLKNRLFQKKYAALVEYFDKQFVTSDLDQLASPAVGETVANLRRTDLNCRIILCGSPIFNNPTHSAFSMAGRAVSK